MTIDEAIELQMKIAGKGSDCWKNCRNTKKHCKDCMAEHEQIAELLEELKELRNMTAGHLYAVAFNKGYLKAEKETRNKAIDDCLLVISENREKFIADICYSDLYDSIVQLKELRENES